MDKMCNICGGSWNSVRHVTVSHLTREWKRHQRLSKRLLQNIKWIIKIDLPSPNFITIHSACLEIKQLEDGKTVYNLIKYCTIKKNTSKP